MINHLSSSQTRLFNVALVGAFIVSLGVITYPILTTLSLSQIIENDRFVVGYAYLALAATVSGLCVLFYGVTALLINWSTGKTTEKARSFAAIIAKVLAQKRYARLLVLSALVYGVFYSFASGIIVFQPAVNFAAVYHVGIPSTAVAMCCGPIGETPEAVVYLTQHVGLLLVPMNLILLFSISWLVGFNVSFTAFAMSFRSRSIGLGWFGGVGALIGLFTSCPTCAGLAIIALLGGTGTLSAALFLGPLQTFLIGLSMPMLVAAPIISARSLRSLEGRTCDNPRQKLST